MSTDHQEPRANIATTLSPWIQLFLGIVAVLGILWAIVQFLNPLRNTDITVWIQKEIPIDQPSFVGSSPVELVYKGTPINRATVLQINISNTGSMPIGEKGKWEEIMLIPDNNARIAMLSQPVTHPSTLEFRVSSDSLTNALTLMVGLFNPRDYIELQLIVINPQNVNHPTITAPTRIPKLSEGTTTRKSIEDRLESSLYWPVAIFGFLVTLITFKQFRLISKKDFLQGNWDYKRGIIVSILFATWILSYILTQLVIWLIISNHFR